MIGFKPAGGWLGCLGVAVAVFVLQAWVVRVWFKYQLLKFDGSFLVGTIVLVIAFSAAGWFWIWRSKAARVRVKNALLLGVTGTLLVGFSGYLQLNAVLDGRRAEIRTYVVESRDCTRGRRHRPRLFLRPLDAINVDHFTLEVPLRMCRDTWPNTRVLLEIKPGFFGSPWVSHYEVIQNVEKGVPPD